MTDVFSVDTIKQRLQPIFANYHVQYAVLFGSYAKGCATKKSDIDLMVDSNLHGLRFFALKEDISEALDEKDIDIFDITHIDSNSKFRKEISSTGVRIYG